MKGVSPIGIQINHGRIGTNRNVLIPGIDIVPSTIMWIIDDDPSIVKLVPIRIEVRMAKIVGGASTVNGRDRVSLVVNFIGDDVFNSRKNVT